MGSGFSIDGIIQVKEQLFNVILKESNNDKRIYIIISANEFELVDGENCFDVQECKYRKFKTYKVFKNFVIKSRERRDNTYKE